MLLKEMFNNPFIIGKCMPYDKLGYHFFTSYWLEIYEPRSKHMLVHGFILLCSVNKQYEY